MFKWLIVLASFWMAGDAPPAGAQESAAFEAASMSARNVGEAYFGAYVARDWDRLAPLLAEGGGFTDPTAALVFGPVRHQGKEKTLAFFREAYAAIAHMQFNATRTFFAGHYAVFEGTLDWTLRLAGGRSVEVRAMPFMTILRVESGLVVEHSDYADYHAYYAARAVAPAAQPAGDPALAPALAAFREWVDAYQRQDYARQWSFTHPRIRHWLHSKRWSALMKRSVRDTGSLVSVKVLQSAPVDPAKIPCTERKHCYRKDMTVVAVLLETRYTLARPAQPEVVYMALSDEGWRFGGGTFPNLPAGETIVILDDEDEARYRPRLEIVQ